MNPSSGKARACARAVLLSLAAALSACKDESGSKEVLAEQAKPIHRFDHLQSVAQANGRLVSVGAFGVVVSSSDEGRTWRRVELQGAPGLVKVSVCGDGSFAALDFDGGLWTSKDGEAGWTSEKIPATDALLDMTCTADNRIWAVGARGAIFLSGDKGKSWDDKSLAEDIQLLNVQFPAAGQGVITGEFGRVLATSDNGASWSAVGSLGQDFYPQGQDFRDALHGTVVGLSGAVLDTADGGKTWTRSKAPTEAPLYGVLDLADGRSVVVGAAGMSFLRQGEQWQPLSGLPMADLRGLAATSSQLILAGTGGVSVLPLSSLTIAAK